MMDSEDFVKQDQETQKWLKDIESLRSPPPPRKLVTSEDQGAVDSREGSHFSSVSATANGREQSSDGDFISKIKQFQLSNSHPYANKNRVETAKKIAAQGGSHVGISSIAADDKQKRTLITKQEADHLRDTVKKETRPLNPYPSPYANLDSDKRLRVDVNNGAASDYSSSAYSSYSSAIDRDSKSTTTGLTPYPSGSSPAYSGLSPGSRVPVSTADVEPIYRISEKKVHNSNPAVKLLPREPASVNNLTPSYSPAGTGLSPRIAVTPRLEHEHPHPVSYVSPPFSDSLSPRPAVVDSDTLRNVMNDRELSAAFEDFDRDYVTLSHRSLSRSPDRPVSQPNAAVGRTVHPSPPPAPIQNGVAMRAPPPPYRRTNSSSVNRFAAPGAHARQSSSPISAPSPPIRQPAEYPIRNRSNSMQEFAKSPKYNNNNNDYVHYDISNNYERAVTGRDIIVDRIPPPQEHYRPPAVQKSDSFNNVHGSSRLSADTLDSSSHRISPAEALEEQQRKFMQLQAQVEQEMQTNVVAYGVCHFCNEKVTNPTEATQALGNLYHARCFTCCCCGRALKGKKFYEVRGKVYCEEDYLFSGFQQSADRCAVCGHLIMDMILQAVGKSFHPGCFRCVSCKESLDGVPFTMDDQGRVYCITDYHRLFAPKCAKCFKPITPAVGCGLQLTDEPEKRCYPLGAHLLCHRCHIHWSRTGGAVHPITDL